MAKDIENIVAGIFLPRVSSFALTVISMIQSLMIDSLYIYFHFHA
jgi:hypothetical protein